MAKWQSLSWVKTDCSVNLFALIFIQEVHTEGEELVQEISLAQAHTCLVEVV